MDFLQDFFRFIHEKLLKIKIQNQARTFFSVAQFVFNIHKSEKQGEHYDSPFRKDIRIKNKFCYILVLLVQNASSETLFLSILGFHFQ